LHVAVSTSDVAFDSKHCCDIGSDNVLGELAEAGGAAARPAWH